MTEWCLSLVRAIHEVARRRDAFGQRQFIPGVGRKAVVGDQNTAGAQHRHDQRHDHRGKSCIVFGAGPQIGMDQRNGAPETCARDSQLFFGLTEKI